jgi:subtilisin family serine protease
VVDEFESQNQPGIAEQTAGSNLSQSPEEIQMDTNGDGVVDEFESQIADELVSIRNSFIVKLRSDEAGRINETIDFLKPDLQGAGGSVKSIYEDFGMFNLKFDGPQQAVDQVIEKLKVNPAVEAVYNDTIITNDQSTPPGTVIPQLCDNNTPPNSNGICSDKSIPHYVTLRQQTECNEGSCVTKWIRAQQRTPTGIDRVDADLGPAKAGDGKGTVGIDIAILDTGVDRYHPDLNVWKCVSFVDGEDPNSCNDTDGHGTHVAGTAAALDNDVGVVGTAPGARIWAIKVQKDDASGTSSDLLEGLQFVAEHSPATQAARSQLTDEGVLSVASMSIGSFSKYNLLKSKRDGKNIAPQLDEAIKDLVGKGVVVVVSAGNDNIDVKDQSPARVPEAIVVSAITDTNGKCGGKGVDIVQKGVVQLGVDRGYSPQTDRYGRPFDIPNPDDTIASYSNYGSTVDLAAPGTHIYSTLPNGRYGYLSGTSMAAPHVAGAAALYLVLHNAAPAEVEAFLKKVAVRPSSGDPLIPCDGNGKGYFNGVYSEAWDTVVKNDKNDEPLLYMGGTNDWCQGVIPQHELCASQVPIQRHVLK